MRAELKKNFMSLITFLFGAYSILFIFYPVELNALENADNILIKKVSQSYTKKFCNSIGFGLSKESAMKFSIKENNQVFKKRKKISDINKEVLAEEIAISVIEKCGYPINLSGEKGILEFKNYYLSEDKELSQKN
tara:strand:- start:1078 stop:1482 length:405 start_codon:yes stop_codon:yes gene_type:complete